jgi:hypothetical protein
MKILILFLLVDLIALSLATHAYSGTNLSGHGTCQENIIHSPSVMQKKVEGSDSYADFAQCYVVCQNGACNNGFYSIVQISDETVGSFSFNEIKTWLT